MPSKLHPKAATRSLQMRKFQCSVCGEKITAPKLRGRTHEGHIKHMYCRVCQEETEHIQIE